MAKNPEQDAPEISLGEWLATNTKSESAQQCTNCGCRRNTVRRTTQDTKRNLTYRERVCDYCGHKFATTEENKGQTP